MAPQYEKAAQKMFVKMRTGADAINISGLLNPKKLGNFKNQMLDKNFQQSRLLFPKNLGVQTQE